MAFNLSVTAQDLNSAIVKANAAAPQSTTYTKAEVDTALAGKANTSSLAAVATSGSYSDLSNKPTLGTAAAANTTTSITSGGTGLPTSGTVYGVTGNKTSLTTTAKTTLVAAINEINGTIGDINTVLEGVL